MTERKYSLEESKPDKSAYEKSSTLAKLIYTWVNPLLELSRKRVLCRQDLSVLPANYKCELVTARFELLWSKYRGRWSKIILNFDRPKLIISFSLIALSEFISWGVQLLLRQLIEKLETRTTWNMPGEVPYILYIMAVGFFFLTALRSLVENAGQSQHMAFTTKVKMAIMGSMYLKSQKFSHGSREKYSCGSALNSVSIDPNKVYNFISGMSKFWLIPFRLIISFSIGFSLFSIAILPGIFLVLIIIPVLLMIANITKKYRFELATISDDRLRETQESLQSIKVIKYLAWEDVAANKILLNREKELKLLKKVNSLYALSIALTFWTPIFAATLSIATLATMNGTLIASELFALSLAFQNLVGPLRDVPSYLSSYVSAKTAINRISNFMLAPEASDTFSHDLPSDTAIIISNADMVWDAPPPDFKVKRRRKRRKTLELPADSTLTTFKIFKLNQISLSVPKKSLVAIIGPIGSGKTSLLESLMGSLKIECGTIALPHCRIGYCEQQAWICNTNVRDNIIFGRSYDETLYRHVIEECCLGQDLELFPFGDETIIGEKGANISGGQRQRIGLARVFYAQPDLVLLDDPFSAVDANVGRQLFYSIKNGLLKDKTRIIATHNRSILDKVDLIVVMDKGRIKAQGSYEGLLKTTDPKLAAVREILLHSPLYEHETDDDDEDEGEDDDDDDSNGKVSSGSDNDSSDEVPPPKIKGRPKQTRNPKRHEERISRKASPQSYAAYIEGFGGIKALIFISFLVVLTEVARIAKDLYVKSRIQEGAKASDPFLFISLYSGLGILQGVLSGIANIISVICCTWASRFIHTKCIDRVLSAKLLVFDNTPIGRVLNRFTRDLETIDNNFPDKLTFMVTCFSTILAALIIIVWTAPMIAITFVLPVILAYAIQKQFGRVWRQLQQLQGQTLGPVVAHFSETISGLPTIKALGANALFIRLYYGYVDEFCSSNVWSIGMRRWLSLRSEIIANGYVSMLMVISIYLRIPHQIEVVSILITYMINVADCIDWCLKTLSEVEICFVSVERLYKYVMDLESEKPLVPANVAPLMQQLTTEANHDWPTEGRVIFENVTVKYRAHLPPALSELSFTLNPGEKVAVVGRTGAGKSSIITCLFRYEISDGKIRSFRFVELTEGRILIDGRDISQIPLKILRRPLAMVPQDPILFSGTLRQNLDPDSKLSDAEIWNALEKTFMRELVVSRPEKLDIDVGERGGSFSSGQKQLLCLARAILRKSQLVIMDEATSSIDKDTDALIQHSLRSCFQNITVITIAHRLETIMEYDRVIVMGDGRILEIGVPRELARTKGTDFANMVNVAGINIDDL